MQEETQELQLTQEASELLNDIRNDIRSHVSTNTSVEEAKNSVNLFSNTSEAEKFNQSDYRDTAYQDRYQDTAYRDTSTYNDNAGYRDGAK